MLIQILLFLLLGISIGMFTGLIPGIHINLVGAFLISLSSIFLFQIDPLYLVVFIIATAITHTFIDFIPSIFLGCPDTDTELSVLPGHELLKKGQGYQAISLTAYGGLVAIILLLIYCVPFIYIVSKTYEIIRILIPLLLIIISAILIYSEKRKFSALLVFLLTGSLGLCVLNIEPEILNQPLLPLLTGLFGSSMLVISIKNKIKIPKQKISKEKINFVKPLIGASLASPLCSFLPGLGSGQAAIIGNIISKTNKKGFLALLGATNTFVMSFSFIALYVISRTRTGAAVVVKELIGEMPINVLVLILFITLISGVSAFFLTIYLAKFFSQKIEKINYVKLSVATLIVLAVIVFLVSGFLGLIILIISTLTGIYSINLKVRRTNMMGCLLLPVIIWYLI